MVVDPLANDAPVVASQPLDPTTVRLLPTGGDPTNTLRVEGKGRFDVATGSGRVSFTPDPGTTGQFRRSPTA